MTKTSPGLHLYRGYVFEHLGATAGALDPVLTWRTRQAASHAEGRHLTTVRQNRCRHLLERTHATHGAVAAAMIAVAARSGADREVFESHRQAEFKHFRVGQARVGHVRLHDARAVEVRPGPRAASDRLIILVAVVTEGEVIHRALARRHHA